MSDISGRGTIRELIPTPGVVNLMSGCGLISRINRGAWQVRLELVEASVVVLAQDHNPSILHPSFLASQGIVPEEWQCAEPPICTPAFSVTSYANGVVFTVESHRFQVQDKNPQGNGSTSPAPELAARYIRKLPYVRYRAVGINLTGF